MRGPVLAGVGQCDQVAGQIAAVHRRDIGRVENPAVSRVVPVVEMPLYPRQRLHRAKGRGDPAGRLTQADPAEIAGCDSGQKIKPHICGRSSVRERRVWLLLKVVRGQMAVFWRDEGLEIVPCPACDQAQFLVVLRGKGGVGLCAGRLADAKGDERRGKPEGCKGQDQGLRTGGGQAGQACGR